MGHSGFQFHTGRAPDRIGVRQSLNLNLAREALIRTCLDSRLWLIETSPPVLLTQAFIMAPMKILFVFVPFSEKACRRNWNPVWVCSAPGAYTTRYPSVNSLTTCSLSETSADNSTLLPFNFSLQLHLQAIRLTRVYHVQINIY